VDAFAIRFKIASGTETRSSFFITRRWRALTKRPNPRYYRDAAMFNSFQEVFSKRLRSKTGWVTDVLRTGLDFVFKAGGFLVEVR